MTGPAEYPDSTSLGFVRRDALRRAQAGETFACPCCRRDITFYRRPLHSGMARALVKAAELGGDSDFVLGTATGSHEFQQLLWWELVYPDTRPREDGGRRGMFRLTQLGLDFIAGHATLPRQAIIFDGRCFGFLDPDDQVSLADCLKDKFDLPEILAQVRRINTSYPRKETA